MAGYVGRLERPDATDPVNTYDSTGPAPLAGSCMGLNHSGITGLTLMPTPSCRLGVQFHPACRAAVHFVAGVSGDGCGLASEVQPRPAGPALGRRLRISSITGRSNVASTILPCREAAGRERRLMAGTDPWRSQPERLVLHAYLPLADPRSCVRVGWAASIRMASGQDECRAPCGSLLTVVARGDGATQLCQRW